MLGDSTGQSSDACMLLPSSFPGLAFLLCTTRSVRRRGAPALSLSLSTHLVAQDPQDSALFKKLWLYLLEE